MLSMSKLSNELLRIFSESRSLPATINIFASEFADMYDNYAKDSKTYANNGLVSAGKSVMQSNLLALDTPGNTASSVANIISQAVSSYWISAVYMLSPFPPGFSLVHTLLVAPPSASATSSCMSSLISAMSTGVPAATQASLWASAIHTQTQSVKTTHIGLDTTLPTPLPKTEADQPIM